MPFIAGKGTVEPVCRVKYRTTVAVAALPIVSIYGAGNSRNTPGKVNTMAVYAGGTIRHGILCVGCNPAVRMFPGRINEAQRRICIGGGAAGKYGSKYDCDQDLY
jgi:hypothetical protein